MLRYFRFNDPYRLLGVLVIMLIIFIPLLINQPPLTLMELKSMLVGEKLNQGQSLYVQLIDTAPPLGAWFDFLFNLLFERSLLGRRIMALVIIFFQASYFGLILIDKKAFSESSFVPSVIFIILIAFSFDTLALTPELLASAFLLMALHNLFREVELREEQIAPVFNLGLFIGVASLFNFSTIIYLFGCILILAINSRSALRKYLLMIIGFLLPHMLIISIYFLKDGVGELWSYFYAPNISFTSQSLIPAGNMWLFGAIPLGYFLISILMLNRESRFTKYQSQLLQVMFLWMIFSVIQVLYSKNLRPQSFITLIPGLAFFITHFLLLIRRKKLAELNFWILLLGVITISYLATYGYLLNYEKLIVRPTTSKIEAEQKLLILDHDLRKYQNNAMATGFLNWNLSKDIFEHPEYYENVSKIYKAFEQDPPDIIIDPDKLMVKVFERMPQIKKQYQRTSSGYKRINN